MWAGSWFQAGRVHTQALAPGLPGKGLGEASVIPMRLGLALATPLHGLLSSSMPSQPLLQTLAQSHRRDRARIPSRTAQLPGKTLEKFKGFKGTGSPKSRVLLPPCQWLPRLLQGVITGPLLAQAHVPGRGMYPL